MVCHRAITAMQALESAGVRAAAFKGLGMIASVYSAPSSRMLSDADILFEKKDFPQLTRILGNIGFQPAISISFDAWLEILGERVYPVHDFVDFDDSNGTKLDLHWRVRAPAKESVGIDQVLARSSMSSIGRRKVRVVSREDLILFAAHHLVRDRFAPRTAAKDLSDIAAIIQSTESPLQVDVLSNLALSSGLSVSVLAAFHVLCRYDNRRAATIGAAISASCNEEEQENARRLGEIFFLQLERGVLSDAAIGLTDVTPMLAARFVVSRLKSLQSSSYRRHKFARQVSGEKQSQSARLFLRDLFTMTPRRFAAYRALARESRAYAEEKRAT
jgi:hypothetical protein